MEISIISFENYLVKCHKSVTSDSVIRGKLAPDRNWFKLYPGMCRKDAEKVNGEEVFLTGIEYIINHRRYDLKEYGIKCILTPSYILIPILREAKGKEVKICQGLGYEPEESYWPIIEKLPIPLEETEKKNETSKEIAKEALQNSSGIDEYFDGNMIDDDEDYDPEIPDYNSSLV